MPCPQVFLSVSSDVPIVWVSPMKSLPLALGDLKWDAVSGFGWAVWCCFCPRKKLLNRKSKEKPLTLLSFRKVDLCMAHLQAPIPGRRTEREQLHSPLLAHTGEHNCIQHLMGSHRVNQNLRDKALGRPISALPAPALRKSGPDTSWGPFQVNSSYDHANIYSRALTITWCQFSCLAHLDSPAPEEKR